MAWHKSRGNHSFIQSLSLPLGANPNAQRRLPVQSQCICRFLTLVSRRYAFLQAREGRYDLGFRYDRVSIVSKTDAQVQFL